MTPSCPSLKRRSSGRWRRSTKLRGCRGVRAGLGDAGTGGEGLGQRLAAPLLRAPGQPRAEGGSLLRHGPGRAPD